MAIAIWESSGAAKPRCVISRITNFSTWCRPLAHQFVDSLCIPASAAHKEEATQFLNYILRPEVSKLISDKFPYTNPNAEARKLLSKDQLDNPASYPKTGSLEIFHAIGKNSVLVDRMMTQLRGGQ